MNEKSAFATVTPRRQDTDNAGRPDVALRTTHRPEARGMVYLSGPISGISRAEASAWRDYATVLLQPLGTFNPLRRDFTWYEGAPLSYAADIVNCDKSDIMNSAAVLVRADRRSVGTSMEVMFAHALHIPVVTVNALPRGELMSPWLVHHSVVVVPSLEEGCAAIRNMLANA